MGSETEQKTIHVEVVFAMPDQQELLALDVAEGTTIAQAIAASGIADLFDGIELNSNQVGIFSQKATMDQVLRDGDRVEIYRPLLADPMESRRRRALKQAGK